MDVWLVGRQPIGLYLNEAATLSKVRGSRERCNIFVYPGPADLLLQRTYPSRSMSTYGGSWYSRLRMACKGGNSISRRRPVLGRRQKHAFGLLIHSCHIRATSWNHVGVYSAIPTISESTLLTVLRPPRMRKAIRRRSSDKNHAGAHSSSHSGVPSPQVRCCSPATSFRPQVAYLQRAGVAYQGLYFADLQLISSSYRPSQWV